MGERNNGYAGCDLRGLRGLGGFGSSTRRARGEVEGCGCHAQRDSGYACESDRPRERTCDSRGAHAMMHKLQELDFSIQETVLYLDAYPKCTAALKRFHQLVGERRALAEQYERQYGPLIAMGNEKQSAWEWTQAPWPWHPDFPGNKQG